MSHWRSGTFWAWAILGWSVTMIGVTFMVAITSPYLSGTPRIATLIGVQILSLAVGYAEGKQRFDRSKPDPVGFPVVFKDGSDSVS